jgi:hypothetical protein
MTKYVCARIYFAGVEYKRSSNELQDGFLRKIKRQFTHPVPRLPAAVAVAAARALRAHHVFHTAAALRPVKVGAAPLPTVQPPVFPRHPRRIACTSASAAALGSRPCCRRCCCASSASCCARKAKVVVAKLAPPPLPRALGLAPVAEPAGVRLRRSETVGFHHGVPLCAARRCHCCRGQASFTVVRPVRPLAVSVAVAHHAAIHALHEGSRSAAGSA